MPFEVEAPTPRSRHDDSIVVALVNNMPDAALKATEQQFAALLMQGAGPLRVRLRLTHLPEVPREAQPLDSIDPRYWRLEQVLDEVPDALIITGSEPRARTLDEEPYWKRLAQLLDWAQTYAAPSIWSCLAAHAAVQALDGIRRMRLPEKRFGVFEHQLLADVDLLEGIDAPLVTPHSRWNDLPAERLRAAGYSILSASPDCGVDMFMRQDRALLVGFQGHPEYDEMSLLKEYRRDVGRFLAGERNEWPQLPSGYFSNSATEVLRKFRERTEPRRDPSLLAQFPLAQIAVGLHASWRPAAVRIYRNWLEHVAGARRRTHSQRRVEV